jgi:hypothetical protein
MVIEAPNWLQNVTYAARLDRGFIEKVLHGAERVFDGLAVTQSTPTPNFNVAVSAGSCAVFGDDQANQGMYFVRSTAIESLVCPASPGAGTRTDTVIMRVNDPQAGGAAGNNATLSVISGTTVPASAIAIATIARTAGESAILNAAITDVRPLGSYPYTVSTAQPPANGGVEGDLWIVVA